MLKIDVRGNQFTATLDLTDPHYKQAYIILRSLLTAKNIKNELYSLSYQDFVLLKQKLDSFGLVSGRTMTKAAKALFQEYTALRKRNFDIKEGIHNDHIKKLLKGKLKTTPYPDQLTGISYLVNNDRAGVFDSMGLGKSLESLGFIAASSATIRRSLIVAPKSVLLGFEREIKKHTSLKYVTIPAGRKAALEFVRKNKTGNWDIMLVHPENLVAAGAAKSRIYGDVLKVLKTIKFDLMLVDEFHLFKSIEAKRTKCVMALANEIRDKFGKPCRLVVMTGTPVSESPANAYVFLKLLGSEYLPHFTHFENHFTIKKDMTVTIRGKNGRPRRIKVKKVVGYKNLSELKERIEQVSIRRTKADMVGFPDQVFVIRDVELVGKQKKLYKAVCKQVVTGLSSDTKINLANFFSGDGDSVKLRQLLNHPAFLEESGESAKYKEIDNILEDLFADPDQKVVIWSEYRKAIDLIYERWNKQYGVIKVYGGVDITDADVTNFENNDMPRIAACIPAKAGTGVDWLARARTAIYIDRPYSYNLSKQSIDRIHRRVKTEGALSRLDEIRSQPATVIYLDVPGSIDELVKERLELKEDVADAVTISNKKLVSIGRRDLLRYLR